MPERTSREILEDVAAGRIDPAEAARQLDELSVADVAESSTSDAVSEARAGGSGITGTSDAEITGVIQRPGAAEVGRVLVRATSRRVRIVGDPSVATVSVEGPHTVRRDGATLVVTGETEIVPADDTFMLLAGGRWREVADRFQQGFGRDLELTVRVRPDLSVGVEVIAGSLQADGAAMLDHVRVTAGSCRVRGVETPVDLLVQAGSAQLETRQTHGRSRVRCESGSLQLTLLEGSDITVRSDVQLGRFTTEPERRARDRQRDVVLGTGSAEMDVEVVMGSVTVKLPPSGAGAGSGARR